MKAVINITTKDIVGIYSVGSPASVPSDHLVIDLETAISDIEMWQAVQRDSDWTVERKPASDRDALQQAFQLTSIRHERNRLLAESDWTQVPDSPLSAAKKAEWQTYRQALRDITTRDVFNFTWPTKPN